MALSRIAAPLLLATTLCAQVVPSDHTTHILGTASGIVRNDVSAPDTLGIPRVVWSHMVTVPKSSWLRLEYEGVLLSGSADRGADGSFLRLTSMRDGAVQTQHLKHVGEWQDTSAYFNGGSVMVELLAQPGTGNNRFVLKAAVAGPQVPVEEDDICGAADNRVLSSDPRIGRLVSGIPHSNRSGPIGENHRNPNPTDQNIPAGKLDGSKGICSSRGCLAFPSR